MHRLDLVKIPELDLGKLTRNPLFFGDKMQNMFPSIFP